MSRTAHEPCAQGLHTYLDGRTGVAGKSVSGSKKACSRCSSGKLNQTVDGRSCTLATAVALPPLLGAAPRPLPGREVARDGAWEVEPEGGFGGVEGLMYMERVTLGVMPLALVELLPAQSTGQTCSTRS